MFAKGIPDRRNSMEKCGGISCTGNSGDNKCFVVLASSWIQYERRSLGLDSSACL